MMLLKEIEIENYRNIRYAKLEKLNDLNIFIGPNNCGKTNILNSINILGKIERGNFSYLNKESEEIRELFDIPGIRYQHSKNDIYESSESFKIRYLFSQRKMNLKIKQPYLYHVMENFFDFILKSGSETRAEHIGIPSFKRVHTIFSPENRFERYEDLDVSDYILKSKNISAILKFIREVVDSKARLKNINLNSESFERMIEDQGFGIRSVIFLAVDIMNSEKDSVILLDDPEMGLSASAKHEFLKFLLEESRDKQIFISTHDPTFVNPLLLSRNSIYLFSLISENYVRININESREDPVVFAGYLPHTISLKKKHIYVEGTLDVYIYQTFLKKYLKSEKREWQKIYNNTGIYHLAGDFWSHLLYTIPKDPYEVLIVLDGDKREKAKEIVKKYNRNRLENLKPLKFCPNLRVVKRTLKEGKKCPVYCLQKKDIEEYLRPYPKDKRNGPSIAERMKLPLEFKNLFRVVYG